MAVLAYPVVVLFATLTVASAPELLKTLTTVALSSVVALLRATSVPDPTNKVLPIILGPLEVLDHQPDLVDQTLTALL